MVAGHREVVGGSPADSGAIHVQDPSPRHRCGQTVLDAAGEDARPAPHAPSQIQLETGPNRPCTLKGKRWPVHAGSTSTLQS